MIKDFSKLKVAIVTDSMTGFGGSDRLMLSLLKIFPNSEIFTSIYDSKKYQLKKKVHTSFLQPLKPVARFLSTFFPFAFEQFDLDGFDFVISLSAGPAKCIIPKTYQPHLAIILTPPRHYWDIEVNVRGKVIKRILSFGSKILTHYLRIVDIIATNRIGNIVTISKYIQKKVKRIYGKESKVIYPGVSEYWFEKIAQLEKGNIREKYNLERNFLLLASRLYEYKNFDWAIKAAIENEIHVYIVGEGPDKKYLKKIAGRSEYVHFLGHVSDYDLRILYNLALCFLFPALEDFGYVAVEAMAQGTPVFCLNEGGSVEIVSKGLSGEHFSNSKELSDLISKKTWTRYNQKDIIKRAQEFSEEKFLNKILKESIKVYEQERKAD